MSHYDPNITGEFRIVSEKFRPGLGKAQRVLVADKDHTTGRLITSIGEKEGFHVVTVEDGREVYEILRSYRAFRAVVFDVSMAQVDTVELVRFMKADQHLMRIPIVIVADEQGLGMVAECFAAGAVAFLPKPFTTEQLRRTFRMVISRESSQI